MVHISHAVSCKGLIQSYEACFARLVIDVVNIHITKDIQMCQKKVNSPKSSVALFVLFHLQAYHSSLMDADTKLVGNMALLPLKTQFKGPAPRESERVLPYFETWKLFLHALYGLYACSL